MGRRGRFQSSVGTDDCAALASDVTIDPWLAAVELFHPDNHCSLLSTDDIKQRERNGNRQIRDVTEALASMHFPLGDASSRQGDMIGVRHDPNFRRRAIANNQFGRMREAAASDVVLERRFDVLLSDAARMGYGARSR